METPFSYQEAFSRNIGWLTESEQAFLRTRRIAIAGMGGVGGSHLLTLTRLGVGKFNIADFDVFELANFNRQAGASLPHLNLPKVDVLAEMALAINPTLDIKKFPEGVNADNLPTFLADVDVYVDGLDFFAFEAREALFKTCAELGIPAITAAPIGMGAALISFLPGKMTFEEYFQLEGKSEIDKTVNFMFGLVPAMLQRTYLVKKNAVDLLDRKGASTPMACEICAGFAATQALKILLNRDGILAAPWGIQFDAYRYKLAKTWRPLGNRNPLQRLGLMIVKQFFLNINKGVYSAK
ncbi:MAG: ThiF family adenylyltransferase [Methylococcaceae bacterium]|jgi:molybdopterin/thiamine biosynthesis adenylyltransferase